MSTKITLRIHSVKCLDETGGGFAERVGNDEIYLGGFGIDANGQTVKVPEAEVYAHFDDGDVMKFSPPRTFVSLNLGSGGGGTVTAGFLLVEKDLGGMNTAVGKLYDKVVEELTKKKQEEAARRRVPNLDGLSVDWGAIWGIIAPIVIGYVKEKLVGAFSDDPFPLLAVSVGVPSGGNFGGSSISSQESVEIKGNDGLYRITYDWQLS